MNCPVCGGRFTGRIAADQYFCRECCVEFGWANGSLCVFAPDEEGELVPLRPAAGGEEALRCASGKGLSQEG